MQRLATEEPRGDGGTPEGEGCTYSPASLMRRSASVCVSHRPPPLFAVSGATTRGNSPRTTKIVYPASSHMIIRPGVSVLVKWLRQMGAVAASARPLAHCASDVTWRAVSSRRHAQTNAQGVGQRPNPPFVCGGVEVKLTTSSSSTSIPPQQRHQRQRLLVNRAGESGGGQNAHPPPADWRGTRPGRRATAPRAPYTAS